MSDLVHVGRIEELDAVASGVSVETETRVQLMNEFAPFFTQAQEWAKKAETVTVTDVSQTREMKLAREYRLALREIRINVENRRKSLKEDSLRKGKAIDGMANVIKYFIEPIEEKLERDEKFAEVMEAKRKAELKSARLEKLSAFPEFVNAGYNLEEMPDDSFQMLLNGLENARKERIEAEQRATRERLERERLEAEERARIKAENERLRAEAEAREKQAAAERAEAERVLAEERRKAFEAAEIERKAREAERLEMNRKLQTEQDRIAKIEAERLAEQQRIEAERKRAEAESKQAAKAPRKQKLNVWVKGMEIDLPAGLETDPVAVEIFQKFQAFQNWALKQVENL